MCIPKAPSTPTQIIQQPPLTPLIPATQAASAIQLGGPGGIPRGAAALGRLQLRLSGDTSPAQPKASTTGDASGASPQVGLGGLTTGDAGNIGGTGVQRYSGVLNPNLRLS